MAAKEERFLNPPDFYFEFKKQHLFRMLLHGLQTASRWSLFPYPQIDRFKILLIATLSKNNGQLHLMKLAVVFR